MTKKEKNARLFTRFCERNHYNELQLRTALSTLDQHSKSCLWDTMLLSMSDDDSFRIKFGQQVDAAIAELGVLPVAHNPWAHINTNA